jgi:hypothetical protein
MTGGYKALQKEKEAFEAKGQLITEGNLPNSEPFL